MVLYGGVTFNEEQRPLQGVYERTPNNERLLNTQADRVKGEMRTCIPAKVVSFDADKQTIVAQPLIMEKILDRANGDVYFDQLPQIPDVPVCFPQAGNFVLTMPITAGDEVLLVFADLCIDSWFTRGGVQGWNDRRRHDLSDAIAVIGCNSIPSRIQNIAADATELRTKDGDVKVRVTDDSVEIESTSKVEVTVGDASILANTSEVNIAFGLNKVKCSTTGVDITGVLRINGFNYLAHKHSGVDTGPGVSGGVVP